MNSTRKWIITVGTSISLALASLSASAHPGAMGGDKGQGMHGGRHHGMRGGPDRQVMHQLTTPEERTAMREKMRAAKTPEERQQIAAANRSELQKRAAEKGITLPERGNHRGHGGHGGLGGKGPAVAPSATDQTR